MACFFFSCSRCCYDFIACRDYSTSVECMYGIFWKILQMVKRIKQIVAIVCVSMVLLLAQTAFSDPYSFMGIQLGAGYFHYNRADFGAMATNVDRLPFAGRLFLGYQYGPLAAFEMGYTYFFKGTMHNTVSGNDETFRQHVWDAVLKGIVPLGSAKQANVFVKGGWAWVRRDGIGPFTGTIKRIIPVYGAGLGYRFSGSAISSDLTWTRFQGHGNLKTTDFFALGLIYNFPPRYT